MREEKKKYKVGYTQGVYDMFHIGHLNLLIHAKELCDYLIVGVNSDALVLEYKNKVTVINQDERLKIISHIKEVDECIIVDTLDKLELSKKFKFNAVFIGDDWKGNPRWEKTAEDLATVGIDVVFLPHTDRISSTVLRPQKGNAVDEK